MIVVNIPCFPLYVVHVHLPSPVSSLPCLSIRCATLLILVSSVPPGWFAVCTESFLLKPMLTLELSNQLDIRGFHLFLVFTAFQFTLVSAIPMISSWLSDMELYMFLFFVWSLSLGIPLIFMKPIRNIFCSFISILSPMFSSTSSTAAVFSCLVMSAFTCS